MILLTAFIIYTSATIAAFTLSYLDLRKKKKKCGVE
jgi:Flp pilus assembly protein protease CpaA